MAYQFACTAREIRKATATSCHPLRDFFEMGRCGVAGSCQHRHALAGHLLSHPWQFVRTFVVDFCELLQSDCSAQLGNSLKSGLAGISADINNAIGGDFENIFALDDEGDEKTLRWGTGLWDAMNTSFKLVL
jgi:hypothetical protein